MALGARTGQRLIEFHSKLLKSPSIYMSCIKYYSFDMFLLTCRSLGTKKGQTLTNSERDTHLYSISAPVQMCLSDVFQVLSF